MYFQNNNFKGLDKNAQAVTDMFTIGVLVLY